ncbi:MAG: hypothetical protein ACR2JV_07935 [Gaiellales bacterium]
MHAQPTSSALWTRSGALWRVLDRPLFETRVRELAHAMLELEVEPEEVLALEHATTSEALTFAVAGLEAGLTVRLGLAQPPLRAALVATPVRAAALAREAGIDQVAIPSATTADGGRSLERLAAHGVLQAALHPDALAERTARRRDDQIAVVGGDGTAFTLAELHAGMHALQQVEDLLRPDEPVLIAVALDQPWVLAFALAALAIGAPVAVGALDDAPMIRPGVIVASCADVAELPEHGASAPRRLAGLARRLGRNRSAPPARCLIVADGFVDAELCAQLHLSGTTVLHAVADPRLIAPAALNQPHRHRLDAYGLPLPGHAALIDDDRLVVRGPAGTPTGPLGTETSIGAAVDVDGFVVPAHDC